MDIRAYTNFSKRKNSTRQPSGGSIIHCVLKEDTSILHPVFILDTAIANYTYVSAFENYYFVTDVVNLDANRCELHCTLDPLATYKADIAAYPAFVERAASAFDVFVNDPLLSNQQNVTFLDYASSSIAKLGGSCFVTQVLSGDDASGGVVLYATRDLTPFKKLLQPSAYNATDIQNWIDKKIAQAFDLDVYIGTIKWLPINPNQIGNRTYDFYVGPVNVGIPSGYEIYMASQITSYRDVVYNVAIPTAQKFGDFRDMNPRFSRYTMRLPGVGIVELDPLVMGTIINTPGLALNVQIEIDYVSGDVVYYLNTQRPPAARQVEFARYRGNISVDVPIARSVADFGKSVGTFAGAVGTGAAAGGVVGAAVGAVVGAVGVIANELTPDTSMIGGGGNKSDISLTAAAIRVYVEHYGNKEFATTVAGRPLMQNIVLGNLSGFIKCGSASVPVNAADSVRDEINRLLNSGFYME